LNCITLIQIVITTSSHYGVVSSVANVRDGTVPKT
jgi:hypothetical protein